MNDNNIVYFDNVSFEYNGGSLALDNINLKIDKNELACIVGPNGGGKSTLLKLILGLLHPSSGQIKVFGEKPGKNNLKIGYMPQYTNFDPNFPISVKEIVIMGRLGKPGIKGIFEWFTKKDNEIVKNVLNEVEMSEFANYPFSKLSGGQRQRVLFARAIACQPELLILDEPTSNVDAIIESKIYELLNVYKNNMTIILVSHNLGFVSDLVKEVICVNKKALIHPTNDITDEALIHAYGSNARVVLHNVHCTDHGHEHNHD